jgi:hypothetical protein
LKPLRLLDEGPRLASVGEEGLDQGIRGQAGRLGDGRRLLLGAQLA